MKFTFDPVVHDWHLLTNGIAEAMGVKRNDGLCGGMSLAAVNYCRYGLHILSAGRNEFEKANRADKNTGLSARGDNLKPVFNFIFNSQQLSPVMNAFQDALQSGTVAYNHDDYDKASQNLEGVIQADPSITLAIKYEGLASLKKVLR